MERTGVARRRIGVSGRTCLAAALAAFTLAGCSSGTGSQGGAASCVGIITINGHRYYPWTSRHPLHLTGRTTRARVPGCDDTVPASHEPDTTQRVHEIRGIDPTVAVAGGLIPRPPLGRRIVYVRDAIPGHTGPLPSPLKALVTSR